MSTYTNRISAGRILASHLTDYRGRGDVIVLGLPRGGVPVAHEVARALDVDLDVLVVRKLGMPGQPEVALGAVASGGTIVINDEFADLFDDETSTPNAAYEKELRLRKYAARELIEVARRERLLREGLGPLTLKDRTVLLVDDGSATGATMLAAVRCARRLQAKRVVVALPVASADACRKLASEADDVVCPMRPSPFYSVGEWYRDFTQTQDEDVCELLQEYCGEHAAP